MVRKIDPMTEAEAVCITIDGYDFEAWIPTDTYCTQAAREATDAVVDNARAQGMSEPLPLLWMTTWPNYLAECRERYGWPGA
jgi:hypothetical protein